MRVFKYTVLARAKTWNRIHFRSAKTWGHSDLKSIESMLLIQKPWIASGLFEKPEMFTRIGYVMSVDEVYATQVLYLDNSKLGNPKTMLSHPKIAVKFNKAE